MTQIYPITERLPTGMFLAATAGALDAYTYLDHGGVFAGLQTGNMILMGINLGRGDWAQVLTHLIPFLVFAIGTAIIRSLQHALSDTAALRRRATIVLFFEAGMALVTTIIAPVLPDVAASSLVAIIAAAQLQEFRRLRGKPFMSIMMTGNLRTAAEGLYDAIAKHDKGALLRAGDASATIIALIIGATLSATSTHFLGSRGIIFAVVPLAGAIIYMLTAEPLNPASSK
ncbi:YoaK family protein [Lacticaseibacillus zhaodongensis]|uniref:YoaK family protein n=1 Tax=Lacticaseibacillus zhaodongensis TaxID=2668065 RepID=UPI0012D31E7A|nr:YoaK family protein [Lacticaseibacillus zhaodongensis]